MYGKKKLRAASKRTEIDINFVTVDWNFQWHLQDIGGQNITKCIKIETVKYWTESHLAWKTGVRDIHATLKLQAPIQQSHCKMCTMKTLFFKGYLWHKAKSKLMPNDSNVMKIPHIILLQSNKRNKILGNLIPFMVWQE